MKIKELILNGIHHFIVLWKKYKISAWLFSLLFVYACQYYFFDFNSLGNRSMISFVLFALCMMIYCKEEKKTCKEKKIPFLFAFFFSVSLAIGNILITHNRYDLSILFLDDKGKYPHILFHVLVMIVGFTKMFETLFGMALEKLKAIDITHQKMWKLYESKYFFFIIWLLLFLSWLPALLAYYPGILGYDAGSKLGQAEEGFRSYTTFQPPLHTYIWHLCTVLGRLIHVDELVVYGIIQMFFLSFALAKMIQFFIKKQCHNLFVLGAILFFAFNPVIAIFSIVMVKDVYFSVFFVLFVLELIELIENMPQFFKKKKHFMRFCLMAVLMCMIRNNEIYAYILFAFIALVCLKKHFRKLLPLLIMPIVLYAGIRLWLYPKLGIYQEGMREALSVPIQQISFVVHQKGSEISKEDQEHIGRFLNYYSAAKEYHPRWADPMKDTFVSGYFEENKKEFLTIWLQLFFKYPSEYFSAFLSLNMPYWYIDANTVGDYARPYIEDNLFEYVEYNHPRDSKWPALLEKYHKVATFEAFEGKPLVYHLFSITTPFWLMMVTISVLCYKGNAQKVLIVLPALTLWFTHMAGPVSNFRYIFPMIVLYPIFVFLMLEGKRNEEESG